VIDRAAQVTDLDLRVGLIPALEALERGDRIGRLPIVELVRFDP
jgi:hypothetical protein